MMEFVFILLFLPVTYSVKHTLTFFSTASTGHKTGPEFVAVVMLDGDYLGYCDGINRTEIRSDWMKKVEEDHPEDIKELIQACFASYHVSKGLVKDIQQFFNQTEGVHILQELNGFEFDDQTDLCTGFDFYGYDGAHFISLDPKSMTWLYTERAEPFKHNWNPKEAQLLLVKDFIMNVCPEWLKGLLLYAKTSLQRKVPPSVSLLQKSPSSPISCFATGFYPNRADMFWRRDGEQTHEDVDHGEILPNPDGTFQMRVDLDLSSVRAPDWSRYDCVFQLSGVKDDVITKLDRAVIRTNEETLSSMTVLITAAAAVCALVLMASTAFMAYKKRKAKCRPPDVTGLDHSSELSEELNPKT